MLFVVRVVVRPSRGAPLREISKLMDMNPMFSVRLQSFDREGDVSGRIYTVLAERSDSSDVGLVGIEDTNCVPFCIWDCVSIEQKRCGE